ncbi:methyltransferase [Actinomadura parmotrematis]|uniref:Methyltransferase n=1 Tax=Actinomadura parmotrematis TaxID=2864039 RepID=A0ABS7G226_9ACTN|nr:methyltransferase [Actinomadura parmotrematis]MBW8486586.1 hypothetical protein [Actinomadura parmotrematis]
MVRSTVSALHETDVRRVATMARVAADGEQRLYGLRFDHVGLLVFPESVDAALAGLADAGLRAVRTLPSVVVRDRLAERYGLDRPAVTIAHLDAGEGRTLELFLATGCPEEVAEDERAAERERHLAFEAAPGSLGVLAALRADGLAPDGGGFNPSESDGGRSVFYFRRPDGGLADRVEVVVPGHRRDELAGHLHAADPRREMLEMLTGAWRTQALRAAAELGVADRLFARDRTVGELAAATGCPADRLERLLGYLARLGVVALQGAGRDGKVALTPLGTTLAGESPLSLAGLARLYGGLFYRSFGELPATVAGDASGFELAYGRTPFAHLEDHPADAAVFQQAMADQCREVFDAAADRLDLAGVGTVTDIGGGTGALLSCVLAAAPHASGVLFDTPATVRAARPRLDAERITAVGGDMFAAVPGGDLLVLSRILHDWDDAACARILARCRAAVRPGARLVLLERVLPDPLAVAWDVHMMVNNDGGRERTLEEYRELLAAAGFELRGWTGLPLEVRMLEAVAVPCGT